MKVIRVINMFVCIAYEFSFGAWAPASSLTLPDSISCSDFLPGVIKICAPSNGCRTDTVRLKRCWEPDEFSWPTQSEKQYPPGTSRDTCLKHTAESVGSSTCWSEDEVATGLVKKNWSWFGTGVLLRARQRHPWPLQGAVVSMKVLMN